MTVAEANFARALEGAPLVSRLEAHDEIDSTQKRALDLAQAGAPAGTLVVARRQTAGTGRHGHKWASPEGGLWFSLVLAPYPGPLPISIVSALAVRAAVIAHLGIEVDLKWPNDLHCGRRKFGGVIASERAGRIVLGIGINTAVRLIDLPPEVAAIATSLAEEVRPASVGKNSKLLVLFLEMLERYLRKEPARLREEAWACLIREHPVRWRPPGRAAPHEGRVVALEANGALLVDAGGPRPLAISTGDLEILWPPSR